jgi:hypothetical protein
MISVGTAISFRRGSAELRRLLPSCLGRQVVRVGGEQLARPGAGCDVTVTRLGMNTAPIG